MPDFKGHWSFCLLEGTADINHCDGRLRVLGTAVILAGLQSGFLQCGAIWQETQGQPDGGAFLKGKTTQSCVSLALPELSLRSVRVRLKLELHEMLMQEGRLSLYLPVTLPKASMGSWRDLLRDVFQSQTAFLILDCFASNACFERLFSLAGAAITDMPVPATPCSVGKCMRLAVTK